MPELAKPTAARSAGSDIFAQFETWLSDKPREEVDEILAPILANPWIPQPGPQTEAYLSDADLLLYGGAAGGGKTDLIIGLATCEHQRSVIFRRQASDLDGFWDRLTEVITQPPQADGNKKRMVTPSKRLIECGHLEKPGSQLSWQGRPHDFIGFDEGAQLDPHKVHFVVNWLRTTAPGQRCRVVIGSNPPMGGDGEWLVEWFAPWVDPSFTNPAQPGELRWAVTVTEGDELRTVWIDPADILTDNETGLPVTWINGEKHFPKTRTFIPSKVTDNRKLIENDPGYVGRLHDNPAPIRAALLDGNFMAAREDHAWQIIPTEWVLAANERWRKNEDKKLPRMTALGVDVAQGGKDKTTLAPLHAKRFERLVKREGKETPDGPSVAGEVLTVRRNGALVGIDLTGGWGGSARDHLWTHHQIRAVAFVASRKSGAKSKDGKLGFINKRAESWWKFREALDPSSGEEIELPPDSRLQAQLTTPRWEPRSGKIKVEEKDEIRKRVGSSTDEADAVLIAWNINGQAIRALAIGEAAGTINGQAVGGMITQNIPMVDPLKDF